MAKLATLQLVQPVGARSTTGGPINQEVGAPPPLGFPHTMLSVKKVKDNMQLAFIEKLFTNRKIGINMQIIYLCFKGMSYESKNYLCDISYVQLRKESKNYLCDISYVQLRKVLARFQCGNS